MIQSMYVGGGCFWGLQELFRSVPGVLETRVGYSGGSESSPTYERHTGHAESLEILFDSEKTSYRRLLDFFFRIHDPTTLNRQGNDIGDSYRSVIFFDSEGQKREAQEAITQVNDSGVWGSQVVTTLEPFVKFYEAEAYHQDYLQKYPDGYTCHFIRG